MKRPFLDTGNLSAQEGPVRAPHASSWPLDPSLPIGEQSAATSPSTRRAYSAPAALAGMPAVVVPCGFDSAGLPLSLQIMGRAFEDATVLRAAHAYEQATGWHRRRPPLDAV